jgi:hypothetical protein
VIILKRDSVEVMRGSWTDIYRFIHRTHSYSTDHALRHEGYGVEEVSA